MHRVSETNVHSIYGLHCQQNRHDGNLTAKAFTWCCQRESASLPAGAVSTAASAAAVKMTICQPGCRGALPGRQGSSSCPPFSCDFNLLPPANATTMAVLHEVDDFNVYIAVKMTCTVLFLHRQRLKRNDAAISRGCFAQEAKSRFKEAGAVSRCALAQTRACI